MGLAERKVFGFPDLRTRQGVQMGEENEEEGNQYFIMCSHGDDGSGRLRKQFRIRLCGE